MAALRNTIAAPDTGVRGMVSAVPEQPHGLSGAAAARWLSAFRSSLTGSGEAFWCAVRVQDGTLAGQSRAGRIRRSVVEPGRTDVGVLRHGSQWVLKLRFTAPPAAVLPGLVRLRAEEVGSGAHVELICRSDAARRLSSS